jgi:hypothetical protein
VAVKEENLFVDFYRFSLFFFEMEWISTEILRRRYGERNQQRENLLPVVCSLSFRPGGKTGGFEKKPPPQKGETR